MDETIRFDKPAPPPHEPPGSPGAAGQGGDIPPPPPPPPGAPPPPPQGGPWAGIPAVQGLRRSVYDRKVAGVCGGLARSFGIDPLVLRVCVVVLTLFGGAGALLYGLAWLLLPDEGQDESLGERTLRGRGDASIIFPILVVIVGLSVFGAIGDGSVSAVVVVTLLALGAFVALRGDRPASAATGGPVRPTPFGPAGSMGPMGPIGPMTAPPAADPYGRTAGAAYSPPPPPPPAPPAPPARAPKPDRPKERSGPLALLTISAAAVAAGLVTLIGRATGADVDTALVLGTALAVLGLGLVVSAMYGRAGGVIPVGILLMVLLVVDGVADNPVRGGIGERTWSPVTVEQAGAQTYRLGIGDATLDLRDLQLDGGRAEVSARLGIGELTVLVPQDVALEIQADVNALGDLQLPGRPSEDGGDISERLQDASGAGNGTIVLDLDVNIGSLEVRRAAP